MAGEQARTRAVGARAMVGLLLFTALTVSARATRAQEPPPTDDPRSAEEPEAIEPPRALSTPIEYPEGASGSHTLVVELLISAEGQVEEGTLISGDPVVGELVVETARSWRFEPARSSGERVRARIFFEVRLDPPEEVEEAVAEEPVEPPREQPGEQPGEQTTEAEGTATAPTEDAPLPVVIVTGSRPQGERKLSRAEVRQLPGAFGDAFRAIETLPGVTPIISGLPYFYVRGAPPGNVGYFLDGVRVPLLFHIAAGPSVIHPAFIDSVELHAGPYPARYGRFTGGIVAGQTAPPSYEHRGEASIRLVDAGGMIETHAFDRKLSVMAAGRYSYTSLIASLVAPDFNLSYWDYQGRIEYRASNRDTFSLFGFGALDQASEEQPGPNLTIFDLVFHRLDLRYDRHLDDGGHIRAAILMGTEVSGVEGLSLRDDMIGARVELERPLNAKIQLRGGIDAQVDRYIGTFETGDDDELLGTDDESNEVILPERIDFVTGAHADVVWEAEPGVRVIPGIRADFFVADGAPLWGLAPRLYAEFDVRRDFTLRHGLGLAHQLPSFVLPLPGIQPVGERGLQRAIQHSAGVVWHLPEGFTAEATVFQNIQLNITDLFSAIRFQQFDDEAFANDQRAIGSGRGFELLIRRSLTKRLGGHLAYTLSRSTRSFGAQSGPSSFDRAHVLSSAVGYQLGKGWTAGVRGAFYTGIPAQGISPAQSFQHPPRTRPFYRFDWRLEKRWKLGRKGAWISYVMEVLNTTLNKEVITLDCGRFSCDEEEIGPVTIPSIGVEAAF